MSIGVFCAAARAATATVTQRRESGGEEGVVPRETDDAGSSGKRATLIGRMEVLGLVYFQCGD